MRVLANDHLVAEAQRGRPSVGDPRLQRKAAVILLWFGTSYAAMLLAPSIGAALFAALSLALAAAALGFGVFHDSNHGTLFSRPSANLWAARLCSVLLGPSRQLWLHKHQMLHHRQPNVFGWDDDLETRGLLRLSPASPWRARFIKQEFKALAIYGVNTIEWVFWKDFLCAWRRQLNQWQPVRLDRTDVIELFAGKALYFLLAVVPPFLFLPFFWAAAAFLVFHLVFSWTLAIVFQVAHLTPEMEFGGVRPEDDWATHQTRTTADFATRSRLVTWFTGGLNHQLEHHLFPNVAHTHYAALRPIVCGVAERHGLRCHDLGGLFSAVRQHFMLLRALGASA
jgi:linoleoyl-CoA desaturase